MVQLIKIHQCSCIHENTHTHTRMQNIQAHTHTRAQSICWCLAVTLQTDDFWQLQGEELQEIQCCIYSL